MFQNNTVLSICILGSLFLLAACDRNNPNSQESRDKQRSIQSMELGNTENIHKAASSDLFIASQPPKSDFSLIQQMGVKTVINNRPSGETPDLDEKKIVRNLGMDYHNPAFSSPEELNDETFDRVRELLTNADRPILLHCSSANRASTVWLPYRVLDQGISVEQALEEADKMGLRTPELKEKALAYIRSRQDPESQK